MWKSLSPTHITKPAAICLSLGRAQGHPGKIREARVQMHRLIHLHTNLRIYHRVSEHQMFSGKAKGKYRKKGFQTSFNKSASCSVIITGRNQSSARKCLLILFQTQLLVFKLPFFIHVPFCYRRKKHTYLNFLQEVSNLSSGKCVSVSFNNQ